ncbi:hypothetical protein MAMC_01956 [Methylacidimicrobium cyclopophantes]|uniref:DUF423 domain-containing protein n=1 Tax=Methylacidimicrobium cyclopophantes TaxID=1041766 RepID=A0A5E6MGC0_9BACT|nr:DUF423 domain-containing protein [Methylacidimicrobium cyclopophantes]VVM08062.1 hypothetical protein MAMC_01956 [Methylacidimicrobium cyclopophantes]
MNRFRAFLAGMLGFLAIAAATYGAHRLSVSPNLPHAVETWKTAVLYHFVHVLALLSLSRFPKGFTVPTLCFLFGILLFSGSLYTWILTANAGWIRLTPFGGSLLGIGWLWLGIEALLRKPPAPAP